MLPSFRIARDHQGLALAIKITTLLRGNCQPLRSAFTSSNTGQCPETLRHNCVFFIVWSFSIVGLFTLCIRLLLRQGHVFFAVRATALCVTHGMTFPSLGLDWLGLQLLHGVYSKFNPDDPTSEAPFAFKSCIANAQLFR